MVDLGDRSHRLGDSADKPSDLGDVSQVSEQRRDPTGSWFTEMSLWVEERWALERIQVSGELMRA